MSIPDLCGAYFDIFMASFRRVTILIDEPYTGSNSISSIKLNGTAYGGTPILVKFLQLPVPLNKSYFRINLPVTAPDPSGASITYVRSAIGSNTFNCISGLSQITTDILNRTLAFSGSQMVNTFTYSSLPPYINDISGLCVTYVSSGDLIENIPKANVTVDIPSKTISFITPKTTEPYIVAPFLPDGTPSVFGPIIVWIPAPPTINSVQAQDRAAHVFFTHGDTYGAPVIRYKLVATRTDTLEETVAYVSGPTATSASIGGLSNGIQYTITVSTETYFGLSDPSEPSAPVTPRPSPTDGYILRTQTIAPDETLLTERRAGVELVRQRRTTGQQRFPDHAAYLQYLKGANYLRGR